MYFVLTLTVCDSLPLAATTPGAATAGVVPALLLLLEEIFGE